MVIGINCGRKPVSCSGHIHIVQERCHWHATVIPLHKLTRSGCSPCPSTWLLMRWVWSSLVNKCLAVCISGVRVKSIIVYCGIKCSIQVDNVNQCISLTLKRISKEMGRRLTCGKLNSLIKLATGKATSLSAGPITASKGVFGMCAFSVSTQNCKIKCENVL